MNLFTDTNILQVGIWIIVGIAIATIIVRLIRKKLLANETLKYEFVTIIAHKFRTPLTQMKWLAENLMADEADAFKRETLQEIQMANQGLIDLTGRLIEITDSDATSASSYTLEKIDLYPMIKTIGSMLQTSFKEKNIFFAVQPPAESIFVNADRARIEFVFHTIMNNAYTYTPPGRNVNVAVGIANKKAVVSITDHGIGIDPKDLSRIFSKFFRAENARRTDTEGFGVGLFLAQSVVRRHKGKIEVYSEGTGKGTTFNIILPLSK